MASILSLPQCVNLYHHMQEIDLKVILQGEWYKYLA